MRLYEWNGSSWNQLGNDIDISKGSNVFNGHHSLSLSADGTIVAIGAPNDDNYYDDPYDLQSDAGCVRLYQWDGSSWNQLCSDINGKSSIMDLVVHYP